MSIEKESDGVPEVDLSKRTTKVNLAMVVFVGVFFLVAIALIWAYRR